MPVDLKHKALALPQQPGVYLMKNDKGVVIYVGKAKQLKSRVSQYFQDHASHTAKTRRMVAAIDDFDVIIADTETEAIVLECSLIRQYQPKYNIMLKRSKGYPFIKVPVKEDYPRLSLSTGWHKDGCKYYGPYGASHSSKLVLQRLSQALKLPNCERMFPRDIGKQRPCLNYQMKRCVGVCTGKVSVEQYHAIIRDATLIMEGKYTQVATALQDEMEQAAEVLAFEKAAQLRDRYKAVVTLGQRQKVVSSSMADHDVVGVAELAGRCCIVILHYADGVILDKHTELIEAALHGGVDETLTDFVTQFYVARNHWPHEICLSHDIDDREVLAQLLREKAGRKVELSVPQRGDKRLLTELADKNAREQLEWVMSNEEKSSRMLQSLQKVLALNAPPRRIEACDISNTGDTGVVGAITAFVDAQPKKSDYKLYKVKDVSGKDDYHSMQEVLSRRLKRLKDKSEGFADAPDLILVDGGSTHAAMAQQLVKECGLDIAVFGMVKDDRHRTRALAAPDGNEIGLEATAHLFSFIARIQDETHRFAIQFHRSQRGKASYSSVLDKIEGVGPARRAALLAHFKNMKALRAATLEQLCVVVPYPIAQLVYEFFQQHIDG